MIEFLNNIRWIKHNSTEVQAVMDTGLKESNSKVPVIGQFNQYNHPLNSTTRKDKLHMNWSEFRSIRRRTIGLKPPKIQHIV